MKAALGLISLLIVFAVIALLASHQMKAAGHVDFNAMNAAGVPNALQTGASGTAGQEADQIQRKVLSDVNKALDQGESRNEAAEKADQP